MPKIIVSDTSYLIIFANVFKSDYSSKQSLELRQVLLINIYAQMVVLTILCYGQYAVVHQWKIAAVA